MGNEEELPVNLDTKSLTTHTFITGSTGSGKSNTVYQLLSEIQNAGAHFLVIEPAKGEYKHVFGSNPEVSVYGTNPSLTPLLRINPFIFPNGSENPSQNIHILEHLDRLVEIFNVCWPMYAAMPAVLKDAIEAAYEEAGWDLQTSINRFIPEKYPSFMEVAGTVKTIIERSEYSDENKGNYKGSLITRLKSLTNGINGMIFSHDEISNVDLFDKNVIIDLSRVGSMETKALIMGLLVMKLQEYRITSGKINSGLSHITVLEEAHNLLRRTSTEQASEGTNLLGKSVEMLANAIAEMRTYGEGFIIADQSPGLMDMSVIRNTNTKIILRLPDENDRILVGKSAN
jgi:DNA helicase HerA-like ATPase